jgi:hypothetical protein
LRDLQAELEPHNEAFFFSKIEPIMFRSLLLILLFVFSFDAFALWTYSPRGTYATESFYCSSDDGTSGCTDISEKFDYFSSYHRVTFVDCAYAYKYFSFTEAVVTFSCPPTGKVTEPLLYNVSYTKSGSEDGCNNSGECFLIAQANCRSTSQVIDTFEYNQPNDFSYSCKDVETDEDKCKQTIVSQCQNNFGMSTFQFSDDGAGTQTCTGTCADGTEASPDNGECFPSLENNFCDTKKPDSEIDFGSGGSGSDVLPPSGSTGEGDEEHDIDYEADGSESNPTSQVSSLQADKLINEVVKTRNDNTENLIETTHSTNNTIVEKSDDIQNTISNSANGVIDAINDIDGFNDSGIIDAVDGLGSTLNDISDAVESLTDKSFDATSEKNGFDKIFDSESAAVWTSKANDEKEVIEQKMATFTNNLKEQLTFTTNANGYQANNLDLGSWGSYDISMSRFSDFFGGVGDIVYFLAALTALSIVLGGIRL